MTECGGDEGPAVTSGGVTVLGLINLDGKVFKADGVVGVLNVCGLV